MAKTINEVTPLEREEATGLKVPCSYTTLARTLYFDDGESLHSKWKRMIEPASIPIVEQLKGFSTDYKWDVIRYGYKYANALIHVSGVSKSSAVLYSSKESAKIDSRTEVVLDDPIKDGCIIKYHVNLPYIPLGDFSGTNLTFQNTAIPIVTIGDNAAFATGAYAFSTQACIVDMPNSGYINDKAVEITVIIPESGVDLSTDIVSDFNISVTGFLA